MGGGGGGHGDQNLLLPIYSAPISHTVYSPFQPFHSSPNLCPAIFIQNMMECCKICLNFSALTSPASRPFLPGSHPPVPTHYKILFSPGPSLYKSYKVPKHSPSPLYVWPSFSSKKGPTFILGFPFDYLWICHCDPILKAQLTVV